MYKEIKDMNSKKQVELLVGANPGLLGRLANNIELPGDPEHCIISSSAPSKKGYHYIGSKEPFTNASKKLTYHELMHILFIGDLKPKHDLHHDCTNKSCCNPLHLTLVPRSVHLKVHNEIAGIVSRQLGEIPAVKRKETDAFMIPGALKRLDPEGIRKEWLLSLSNDEDWRKLVIFLYEGPWESIEFFKHQLSA
jgi:hypothetical protein